MPGVERISVEIPSRLADWVRVRVAAGRFEDESDAVVVALETVEDEERETDAWLAGPVADAFDAVETGATDLLSVEEVRARFRR